MRVLVFTLLTLAAMPLAAQAAEAEGCVDLKPFPRLEGCVIVECSAKHHDPFEAGDASGAPLDADTNALSYSCPAGNLQKMQHDFDVELHKAGFLSISEDKSDAASPALSARKGSQWVHWNASTEDSGNTYSLTTANGASEKFKAEACGQMPLLSPLKQCEVVECASKSEDSVAMRTAQKEETSLAGNVQTLMLACPSINASQAFTSVEGDLKSSGFEILFSDREHPEGSWVTGRAGKRWVELVSAPDGEAISYVLTMVPAAEVLSASKPEPSAIQAADPVPTPTPTPASLLEPSPRSERPKTGPVETASVESVSRTPPSEESIASQPVAASPAHIQFIPPKPIHEVAIESTHDRMYSVLGEVVINMLVDVDEDGTVTHAVLAGRVSKDVLKLESAALYAVSQWRFEPARQDGRVVPAVKIPVQMRFRGRPWRF